jgi:hypothetical protein
MRVENCSTGFEPFWSFIFIRIFTKARDKATGIAIPKSRADKATVSDKTNGAG